jgi:hypothetical protein
VIGYRYMRFYPTDVSGQCIEAKKRLQALYT